MKHLLLSISLLYVGIASSYGHSLSKFELNHPKNLIYKVQEDKDGDTLIITNPNPEKPTLRDIIYYHIIEKPYDGVGPWDPSEEGLDFDPSRRPFTNGQGFQFIDEPEPDSKEQDKAVNNSNEDEDLPIDQRKDQDSNDKVGNQEEEESKSRRKREVSSQKPNGKRVARASLRDLFLNKKSKIKHLRRRLPFAPNLSRLNVNRLPQSVRALLSQRTPSGNSSPEDESSEYLHNDRKEPSKLSADEETGAMADDTYGVHLAGNNGLVWNKLKDPKYVYLVGQLLQHLSDKNKEDSSSGSGSSESNSSEGASASISSEEASNSNSDEIPYSIEDFSDSAEDMGSDESNSRSESASGSVESASGSLENNSDSNESGDDNYSSGSGSSEEIEPNSNEIDGNSDDGLDFDDILDELHDIFIKNHSSIVVKPNEEKEKDVEDFNLLQILQDVFNHMNMQTVPDVATPIESEVSGFWPILEGLFTNIIKNKIIINNNIDTQMPVDVTKQKDKSEGNKKPSIEKPTTEPNKHETSTENPADINEIPTKPNKTDADNVTTKKPEENEVIKSRDPKRPDEIIPNNQGGSKGDDSGKNKKPDHHSLDKNMDYMLDLVNNEKFWTFMGNLAESYIESLMSRASSYIKNEIAKQMKEFLNALEKLENKPAKIPNEKPQETHEEHPHDLDEKHNEDQTPKHEIPQNVTNIFVFYPNKNIDEIMKQVKQLANVSDATNIFTFGSNEDGNDNEKQKENIHPNEKEEDINKPTDIKDLLDKSKGHEPTEPNLNEFNDGDDSSSKNPTEPTQTDAPAEVVTENITEANIPTESVTPSEIKPEHTTTESSVDETTKNGEPIENVTEDNNTTDNPSENEVTTQSETVTTEGIAQDTEPTTPEAFTESSVDEFKTTESIQDAETTTVSVTTDDTNSVTESVELSNEVTTEMNAVDEVTTESTGTAVDGNDKEKKEKSEENKSDETKKSSGETSGNDNGVTDKQEEKNSNEEKNSSNEA